MNHEAIVVDGPVPPESGSLIYQVTMQNGAIFTNPAMFQTPPTDSQAGVRWGQLFRDIRTQEVAGA